MRPGADAQGSCKGLAVAMKQIFCRILACGMAAFLIAPSEGAMAEPSHPSDSEGSFCLDGMETVPIADDLVPTPISVDGGCMVSEAVVEV